MLRFVISLCFLVLLRSTLGIEKEAKLLSPNEIHGRIINGENATLGQFPWQVGMFIGDSNDNTFICGGTIISEEWILTAAACIDSAIEVLLSIGAVDIIRVTPETNATEYIPHQEYDATTLANNIGLIRLSVSLEFNDLVAPIALSSEPLQGGEEVTVSGFGTISDDTEVTGYRFLNYVTVATMTNSECAKTYGDALLEDMVCASADGNPVKATCIGDSGGPVVLNADTQPLLVAVASFHGATGCESGDPSGFTRVAYHRDWIKEKTGV